MYFRITEKASSRLQYNRAQRIHYVISKSLEILLFRRFKNEAASHMSHGVFNMACEDDDLITEEEIKMLWQFATEYETYKISAK